jgi:hypothetical protein
MPNFGKWQSVMPILTFKCTAHKSASYLYWTRNANTLQTFSHKEQTPTLFWKSAYDLAYSWIIYYTSVVNNTISSCQLWAGWSNLYTTELKSSVVYNLHPSHCTFYKRISFKRCQCWTYLYCYRKHQCLNPCCEKVPKKKKKLSPKLE